jgi:predicted DNA-binding transcriptional regulator AlpA
MASEVIPIRPPVSDEGLSERPDINRDPYRLIRQAELFERMSVSEATGHRLRSAGKIGPRPVKAGGQIVRYYLPEVLAWLRHRRPDGSLHDAKTWPGMWAQLQTKC